MMRKAKKLGAACVLAILALGGCHFVEPKDKVMDQHSVFYFEIHKCEPIFHLRSYLANSQNHSIIKFYNNIFYHIQGLSIVYYMFHQVYAL